MKFAPTLPIMAAMMLWVMDASAQSQLQTYYYSGPVNGQMDVGLSPGAGYSGQFEAYFGNVTETLYYDLGAQTLEEVGSVAVSPASGSFDMDSTLFYPPTSVGSANLAVGFKGSISFDILFTGNPRVPGSLPTSGDFLVPVSGSGLYEGQAFSGNWNVDLPLSLRIISATSGTLTFSQYAGISGTGSVFGQPVLPNGLMDGAGGDDTIFYSWNQNSVTATVPEPGTVGLTAIGLASAACLLRRRLL